MGSPSNDHCLMQVDEEETQPINLGTADEPQEVRIGNTLTLEERLIDLLKEYKDVFAWSYDDMPGLSTDIVKHKIPLYPDAKPVKQKLRRMRNKKR